MARARQAVERGAARRGRDGIWFSPAGLVHEGGSVAFLFPASRPTFEPRVDDVGRAGSGVPSSPTSQPVPTSSRTAVTRVFAVDRLLDRSARASSACGPT